MKSGTCRVRWPDGLEGQTSGSPFVGYRSLFHSHHLAQSEGTAKISDREYVDLVQRLDEKVAAVDGRGFLVTPFVGSSGLSSRCGCEVWLKDETGNVSGSHKARHLFGLLVHLEIVEHLGLTGGDSRRHLAIASCGNAALAAAVVARAGDRLLDVYIPPWADPPVVTRLEDLGAQLTVCERQPGSAGDPTYHALQNAIAGGALPFTCQGNENGLAIEGGETIGYEVASQLEGKRLDRLFVQVGGGALASACIQGLAEAQDLGALSVMPRIHTVQTEGGHPLERAYRRLAARILAHLADAAPGQGPTPLTDEDAARLIATHFSSREVSDELEYAVHHRSEFMWPWEEEPKSIAHGILDDETYDWMAVVKGMMATGGYPVVVDEDLLREANEIARSATGIDADHTGTAGLAGLLALQRGDSGKPRVAKSERVAVLFTGGSRDSGD